MLAALIAAAAVAMEPSGTPPDPTCPDCVASISLVAVTPPPWRTDDDYVVKFFRALPRDPVRDCLGFSRELCKHWLDENAHGGAYWDDGVAINIEGVPLSYVFHPNGSVPKFLGSDIAFKVHIEILDRHTTYDPTKVRVRDCGPTGTETPRFQASGMAYTFRGHHMIASPISIQADSTTISFCTLDFSSALRSSSGKIIPPLVWRRYTRYFPEVIADFAPER